MSRVSNNTTRSTLLISAMICRRRQQVAWRNSVLWYMWNLVSIESYRFWRTLLVAERFLKSDERFSAQLHSSEKHRLKRIHFERYYCLFQMRSKSVPKNENFIEIDFRSSQILFATWPDAKSSEIAFSGACIEFCWVNETASHRALFSIDFNVYIFEHVDEHIAFVNRTSWLCYVIMLSKHIVLLLLEHDNRHIVFWSMNQISFDV